MKLLNFDLAEPFFAIGLTGLEFYWDLHNGCDFAGIAIDATKNTAVMRWHAPGHYSKTYSECGLIFAGISYLSLSPRDNALPLTEDLCVSSVSKVGLEPAAEPGFRMKEHWGENEEFRLLFQFQSGRSIEIGAETAEMTAT